MTTSNKPAGSPARPTGIWVAALAAIVALGTPTQAADFFKADNLDALNLGNSWTNGAPPTANDVAVWDLTVATAIPQTVSLGADTTWSGIRILDPASAVTISAGNALTLGPAGIDTSLAFQPLTLAGPVTIGAPQNWNLTTAVTLSGVVSGTAGNGITNIGPGQINVSGANNAFVEGITVNAGVVNLTVGSTMPVVLNGGQLTVGAFIGNPIGVLPGGGTIRVTGNRTVAGPITGAGTITAYVTGSGTLMSLNSDLSGFSGTIAHGPLSVGFIRANSATFVGNSNVIWDLGPTGKFLRNNSAATVQFGALMGGASSRFEGNSAITSFEIGHLNLDTTFSGSIFNGSFVKVGTGTLTLDGENTSAGSLTISNGSVQIGNFGNTGTLGTGPVTNYAGLLFNRFDTISVPNVISGTGALTNLGSGKVILTGANSYTGPTTVAAGTIALGTGATLPGNCTVSDSTTLGAIVTAAGTSVSHGNIAFGAGSTYEFDLGAFGNPTAPVVSSSGQVTLNGNVTVNVAGDDQFLSVGSFTLLQYATRSGTGNFVPGSLPPNVAGIITDDIANNRVTVTINSVNFTDPTLRYVGDSAGIWDSDNIANQIWQVVGTGQPTNFYTGAAALFNDSAPGTTSIDINTFVYPESVLVTNVSKTYTFGGSGTISGTTSLTKQGTGTLVITNLNDYTGVTTIEAGTVRIAGETGAIGGGGVTNNGALVIDKTAATNFVPNTLQFFGQISGTGSLTYLGADKTNSILELEIGVDNGNPYSGGTIISNGYVRLNANPVTDANRSAAKSTGLGTNLITFLGDSILELEDYGVLNNSSQAGNFAVPLDVPAGQAGELRTAGRALVSSTLTGAGIFNLGVTSVRGDISGDFSAFTGQINVFPSPAGGGNDFRVFNAAGWPVAKLHLRDRVVLQSLLGSGTVVPVGELSAEEGALIGFGNVVTWRVGSLNTDATNAANISSPNVSFIKEGTGIWTLSGTNLDYTGSTTISNGVLALSTNSVGDAGISNSATIRIAAPGILDVAGRTDGTFWLGATTNAQTLLGNGTIRGSLNAGSLATITPGFGIGTLTVTNAVTFGGTVRMELNRAGSPNSDRIVAPTIAAGGTLTVTNIGGALQAGDTFQLFSTGVSGTFAAVNLPTNDTLNNMAYTWNNTLAANGSITVATAVATVNTTPAPITYTTTGNTLDLQWPVDRTGWTLQTNSVGVAVANAWFPYPGSTTTNQVIITINPTAPQVFFRLVYP